jgi:hypothetical protein
MLQIFHPQGQREIVCIVPCLIICNVNKKYKKTPVDSVL